jgi:hypothetical protein
MANTDWPVNLVAIAIFGWAGSAAAHPEYAAATVNRYLEVDLVAPDRLRLAYTELVGPAPAAALRKAADANGDGKLDAAETRALGDRLRAAVTAGLELSLDGKPTAPPFDPPVVNLGEAVVGPIPFSIDLAATMPLAGAGPHEVRLDDRTPEPLLGETELRLEESPTTALLTAHRGPTGNERETRFLFRGARFSALEDRSVTFRFGAGAHHQTAASSAQASATAVSPWRARLVSLAIFVGLMGLLLLVTIRRARRR